MRITNFGKTLAVTAVAAAMSVGVAQAQNIEWAAGSVGGSWFTVTTGLANIVMDEVDGLNIRIVPGGGRDNPSRIGAGISQLGMGIDFLAAAALAGEEPYDAAAPNLTSLGSTWMNSQVHVIVGADETRSLEEIFSDPTIRIGTSDPATSEYLTMLRMLDYYGSTRDTVSEAGGSVISADYTGLVAAFQNNQIDVLLGAGAAPTGIALEVEAGRRDARVIPFPQDLLEHLNATYGYGSLAIPAGTYDMLQSGVEGDVMAANLSTVVLADAGLDEELVYQIVTALLENQEAYGDISGALSGFDPETAWQNQPVPLHPGAERAYREMGYMD
ncbi:TAXI family TRAP transporter solute-binding subunit [Algicella marina]|uniref:TAXI family TRAP transporter solute-binding subunit n=1 Tax=Algicella marina TaxID=2683284 RepID=A0A6P1SXL5_9RHOB|nr:TAXI family TRAP transporter solute-binding subunit [Algicella marina]QHQ35424.1 TAXI family TRAP transporter solute-binding subunit [Algicella marina]